MVWLCAVVFQVRFDTSRMRYNLNTIGWSGYLHETSRAAMAKISPIPFTSHVSVDHEVICPNEVRDFRARV